MDRFLGLDPPAGGAGTSGRKPPPVTDRKKYPIRAEDYQLFEAVGQGVSACVYRALCIPLDEIVAIKLVDFERTNSDLSNICREAQTMILIDHPNVLKAHCSFVNNQHLWVVMPYMEGGSCLHIMKSVYPNGLEEPVISTVLREVLRGLEYLHNHGHIHRDIKAGNILVDSRGAIKLGDFGVSASLFDSGDRQRSRNTFVGTPCWMAPEVMEQLHGYDFKADIWSFGITALELAHGHAPFSKFPPIKVLLMTLQNAPPGLDYERDKKFSKSFKDMIAMCLVKDPSKRPSAQKLLKQPFFKQARSQDYIVRKILDGLPSLGIRHQALKDKEEDLLAQKKMADSEKEELSQNEYKRGISAWNFDVEDLKAQASSIPEDEETKDSDGCQILEVDTPQERVPEIEPCSSLKKTAIRHEPTLLSSDQPAPYLSTKSDTSDNEIKVAATSDQGILRKSVSSIREGNGSGESCRQDFEEKHLENWPTLPSNERKPSELVPSSKGERKLNQLQINGNCNGEIHKAIDSPVDTVPKTSNPASPEDVEDKMKHPVVQRKGRFKVMSENVDSEKGHPVMQKSHSMQMFSQVPSASIIPYADPSGDLGYSVFPQLNSILQANIQQRDNILILMKQLSTPEFSANRSTDEKSPLEVANEREKELLQEITDLQWRLIATQDELKRLRARNSQVGNVEGSSATASPAAKQS